MTAKSHLNTTLAIGFIPLFYFRNELIYLIDYIAVYVIGLTIGSLFPDIDESRSSIGRKIPLISGFINTTVGHRNLTHNFFVYIPLLVYAYYKGIHTYGLEWTLLIGFCIGAILHILEDCLTNSGVSNAMKPFLPNFVILGKKYRFNTNEKFENYVFYPIISLILIVEVDLFTHFILFNQR